MTEQIAMPAHEEVKAFHFDKWDQEGIDEILNWITVTAYASPVTNDNGEIEVVILVDIPGTDSMMQIDQGDWLVELEDDLYLALDQKQFDSLFWVAPKQLLGGIAAEQFDEIATRVRSEDATGV